MALASEVRNLWISESNIPSKQAQHLKEQICRQQRSTLTVVIRRRNLHQIASHQLQSFQAAYQGKNLRARKSPYLGRARTLRRRRVHYVTVQCAVRGASPALL